MFVPCPHCGFLVALIVSRPDAAQRCPRCGQPLQLEDAAARGGDAGSMPSTAADAAADAGPVAASDLPAGPGSDPDGSSGPASAVAGEAPPVGGADDQPGSVDPPGRSGPPDPAAATASGSTDAIEGAAAAPAATAPSAGADRAASSPPAAAPSTSRTPERARRAARPRRGPSAPSFARRSVSMFDTGPRWPGIAAVGVLLALLSLQLLLAQRDALAAQAAWRPTVVTLCGVLGCEARPWREPDAFTMLARDVRPAAGRAGVLQVEASFRNDAQWPQPWPHLLLRLNDRHGRPVGERLLAPSEYLGGRMSTPGLVAPGQSASARFAVREPAAEVVAFDFDFR